MDFKIAFTNRDYKMVQVFANGKKVVIFEWNQPSFGFVSVEAEDAPSARCFCCTTVEAADTLDASPACKSK